MRTSLFILVGVLAGVASKAAECTYSRAAAAAKSPPAVWHRMSANAELAAPTAATTPRRPPPPPPRHPPAQGRSVAIHAGQLHRQRDFRKDGQGRRPLDRPVERHRVPPPRHPRPHRRGPEP